MESEGVAVPNLINGYKPMQLGQLNIQARYPRQLVIFGPLRWTSFLKYLANGKTQEVCQHIMLTGINFRWLYFTLESIRRCILFIAISNFRLWRLNFKRDPRGRVDLAGIKNEYRRAGGRGFL